MVKYFVIYNNMPTYRVIFNVGNIKNEIKK